MLYPLTTTLHSSLPPKPLPYTAPYLPLVLDLNEEHVIEDLLRGRLTLSILPPPSADALRASADPGDPYYEYYKEKIREWYKNAAGTREGGISFRLLLLLLP